MHATTMAGEAANDCDFTLEKEVGRCLKIIAKVSPARAAVDGADSISVENPRNPARAG